MPTPLQQPALQEQTLRFYGGLIAIEHDWAGKLVIGAGEGCASEGFPAACSLAGAASLLLEPNAADAKAVLRDGGIDFLVSTIDEALRTLKNEIRKGRALAVVVTGETALSLDELMERGVFPDLLLKTSAFESSIEGTGWADVRTLHAGSSATTKELQEFLDSRSLETRTWRLPGRAAVRAFDRALLEIVGEEDVLRKRWLQGITRHQRSADQDYRSCWVTEEELDQIADLWAGQGL